MIRPVNVVLSISLVVGASLCVPTVASAHTAVCGSVERLAADRGSVSAVLTRFPVGSWQIHGEVSAAGVVVSDSAVGFVSSGVDAVISVPVAFAVPTSGVVSVRLYARAGEIGGYQGVITSLGAGCGLVPPWLVTPPPPPPPAPPASPAPPAGVVVAVVPVPAPVRVVIDDGPVIVPVVVPAVPPAASAVRVRWSCRSAPRSAFRVVTRVRGSVAIRSTLMVQRGFPTVVCGRVRSSATRREARASVPVTPKVLG